MYAKSITFVITASCLLHTLQAILYKHNVTRADLTFPNPQIIMRPTHFASERRLAGVHSALLDPVLETLEMHSRHAALAGTRVQHPLAALPHPHSLLFADAALDWTLPSLGWGTTFAATWRTPFGIDKFYGQRRKTVGALHAGLRWFVRGTGTGTVTDTGTYLDTGRVTKRERVDET